MTDGRKTARGQAPRDGSDRSEAAGVGWVPYLLMCAVGLTLGLTWIGPRAGEGLATLNAMAFWAAHVVPALGLLAATQVSLAQIRRIASLPGLAQVLLSAVVASVLFIPVALAVDHVFSVEPSNDDQDGPLLLSAALEFGHFAVPIVLTWTLINAPSLLRIEAGGRVEPPLEDDGPQETESSLAEAEFWSRVPLRLGRDLIALSAELHYLRVYTTLGEALILFPFGRAADALQDVRGMQVHRSHWVALDRVKQVVVRDGRLTCAMVDGRILPVSRRYKAALKAALGPSA